MKELTIDGDVDCLGEDAHGWKSPAGDLALVLGPIVLLARNNRQHGHRLPLPVQGGGQLGCKRLSFALPHPGDAGRGASAQGGTGETVLLPLHCLGPRLHDGRLARREQDGQGDNLGEELDASAVLLDPALELPVVPIVVSVGDRKVVTTLQAGLLDAERRR